jgi:two-component system nitrate/nitrite response regulator NarL
MTERTRVMLVDDHALCRSGLTELLEHRGDMTVVMATGDPAQVVPMLREHQPDLMVLDLRLAATDGLSVLRMIRSEGCETPVVILTMSDSEDDLAAALRAGVRGYLLKDMEPEEVIEAIGRAARGEMVVASAMTLKLAQILQSGPKVSVMGDLVASLTERGARGTGPCSARAEQQGHCAGAGYQSQHGQAACATHHGQAQLALTGRGGRLCLRVPAFPRRHQGCRCVGAQSSKLIRSCSGPIRSSFHGSLA